MLVYYGVCCKNLFSVMGPDILDSVILWMKNWLLWKELGLASLLEVKVNCSKCRLYACSLYENSIESFWSCSGPKVFECFYVEELIGLHA